MTTYSKEDRRDTYHAARDPLDPAILERVRGDSLGMFAGFDLRLVKAALVRNWVDVDFTEGGNPSRYAYVPLNELWVDVANMEADPVDGMAIALHEACEAILMEKDGLSYDVAHDAANVAERAVREKYRQGEDGSPASPEEALAAAAGWMKEFGAMAFQAAKAPPKDEAPAPPTTADEKPEPGAAKAEDSMNLASWAERAAY